MLPSELPDLGTKWVAFDTETTGLYPDDGATVTTVSVAWVDRALTTERILSFAFPFDQGLYGKPEWDTARFGEIKVEQPVLDADGNQVLFKTGKRAGQPKTRIHRRKLTAEEVLPPDPNLGPQEWAALCRWLADRDLSAHGAAFDTIMMGAGVNKPDMPGIDLINNIVWCTFVGNVLLDPQHERALKKTMVRLRQDAEEKDAQDAMKEWLRAHGLPVTKLGLAGWEVTEPYACKDAAQCMWLTRLQYLRVRGGEAKMKRMQSHMRQMLPLIRMERRGIPYRAQESLQWAEKMDTKIEELGQALPFPPTPNGARQYFFTEDYVEREMPDGSGVTRTPCLGLSPIKMTAGGQNNDPVPGIDAEVLETLVDRDVPNARKFWEWKMVSDAVNRYYRGYAEFTNLVDGRLRTRFKQFGTETYRCSCERCNLQAIPHDHRMLAGGSEILALAPSPRALIHPIEGYKLWHADLAQAELRIAASFAECKTMLELIYQGQDLHANTAIGLGLATGPEDPRWPKARGVIGKRANFSCIFGIGWVKLRADIRKQSGIDLGASGAKKLVKDFRELYPEYPEAIELYMAMAERDHRIRIRDDVWRYFTAREIEYRDFHKAFNNSVQGNIGMLTKEWSAEVDEFLIDEGIPDHAGLLLQIHDALVLMLPDTEEGDELARESVAIGQALWDEWFDVPGAIDLKAGLA